jgi:hypothetical protein
MNELKVLNFTVWCLHNIQAMRVFIAKEDSPHTKQFMICMYVYGDVTSLEYPSFVGNDWQIKAIALLTKWLLWVTIPISYIILTHNSYYVSF